MKLPVKLNSFLFIPLLITGASLAQTINVGPGQTYTTIQEGINAASNGDTVLVAPGTYNENINFNGKAITVISSQGAANTIIQGDGTAAVVTFNSAEQRNSVLDGFTIQGVSNPTPSQSSTGVEVGSAPTILNNIITNNYCNGIDVFFGGPLIQGNVISYTNKTNNGQCASFTGSGIALDGNSTPASVVIGNTITNNQAIGYFGGGIIIWAAENVVIEDNVIANNSAIQNGGGIAGFNSDAMIIAQNLFYGNVAQTGGGGISILPPEATQGPFIGLIQNNTFVGNTTATSTDEDGGPAGSQVHLEGNLAQYEFTDNIVVGADANPAFVCGTTYNYLSITPLVIDHNDIYNSVGPAYGGACSDQTGQYGNISSDPMFKDVASNDYHLRSGSPAIDAGNNSALQLLANLGYPLTGDLEGNPRVQDATGIGYPIIDMGVYEYGGTHSASPTTAVLTPSSYNLSGGQSFTLTANLYSALGSPTGTVTFFEDGTQIGTATLDKTGAAVLTIGNGLVPGTHAFLATYPGQGSFTPCESVKIYVIVNAYVVKLTLTSNPNPSNLGQSVLFQMNISSADGVPTGSISLTDETTGSTLATLTPNSNGNASYSTSTLAIGTYLIEAYYAGNATYTNAIASVWQVVQSGNSTTTTLTCVPNPILINNTSQFTATVASGAGTPTGSITFSDNGVTLATQSLVSGSTRYTYTGTATGTHAIVASYAPTGNFAASSGSCSEVVNGLPTTSTLVAAPTTSTYGTPVTLTATVAPETLPGPSTPTGMVTFLNGPNTIGTGTLTNGVATLNTSFLPGGSDSLTCTYGGNTIYAGSNCNPVGVVVNAAPTALTLSSSNNPAPALTPVIFTVHLTSIGQSTEAGNTIMLGVNGQSIPLTTDATGTASYTISTLLPGSYPVTAQFEATNDYQASSAALTEKITAFVTTTTLTSGPNPAFLENPVTFTATVAAASGTPTGTVNFYDSSNLIGSGTLSNGEATFATSNLAIGTHSITARFIASGSYAASNSSALAQLLDDFSVANNSSGTVTVPPLGAAKMSFTIAPSGPSSTIPQAITVSIADMPEGVGYSLTPTTIASGQGAANLTLDIYSPIQASFKHEKGPRDMTPMMLSLLVLPFAGLFRQRGRRITCRLLLGAVALCAALTLSSCGSQLVVSSNTVTVTATSGNLTHSTTFQLVIN